MDDPEYQYELSKLAISPIAQGKVVGKLLVLAIIDLTREKSVKSFFFKAILF